MLGQAGLVVRARLVREPDDDGDFPEREQQAFLLARKPAMRLCTIMALCTVTLCTVAGLYR